MPFLKCATPSVVKYMREIRELRWGEIPSIQSPKIRLLLANHEDRLHGICSQMRQVPAIYVDIEIPSRGTYIHDQHVAIYHLSNRTNRPTSQRERKCTVHTSGYQLLH